MTQQHQDEQTMTNKSIFGWKGVIFALFFAGGFLGFLFLAMMNEPDHMPSKRKAAEQKAQQQAQAQQQATASTASDAVASPASATVEADAHGHSNNSGHGHGH